LAERDGGTRGVHRRIRMLRQQHARKPSLFGSRRPGPSSLTVAAAGVRQPRGCCRGRRARARSAVWAAA
jgi:hypothetical protein